MEQQEAFATYLELRESTPDGEQAAGLSHSAAGLVLLHVLELAAHGEPRGALTIVHDAGGHGGRYTELAGGLACAGWAVALPDLRGHGKSEGARGHSSGLREVLRDLEAVADHLAYRMPEARKVLVGVGLGAVQALAYALAFPGALAGLVLAGPLLAPRFHPPQPKKGLGRLFAKLGPQSPGSIGWRAEVQSDDPARAAELAADALAHDVLTLRACQEAERAARESWPRLSELQLPILVLHGEDDPLVDLAAVRALRAPDLRLEFLAGQRHDPFQGTARDRARELVLRFLDERVVAGR